MPPYEPIVRIAIMNGQKDDHGGIELKSTCELVELALTEEEREGDGPRDFSAISALHARGTREVMHAAIVLCRSPLAIQRRLGARILGELGAPTRTFPEECCDALLGLVQSDSDNSVISQAIFALGHLRNYRCEPYLRPLSNSPDAVIRHAVAFALCGTTSPASVKVLLELMKDSCERVRDWATTGIGQTLSVDGPDIRSALLQRANDTDEFTRAEALHGLARRKDDRVVAHLIATLLQKPEHSYLFADAAKTYLEIDESQDLPIEELLRVLRSRDAGS